MTGSRSRAVWLIGLFGILGLATGVVNIWINLFFFNAALFGVVLFIGALVAKARGWIRFKPSPLRAISVVVWLTLTYLAAIAIFFSVGEGLESAFTRQVVNESHYIFPSIMFAVAGIASVMAVSAALRMLTGVWDRRAFLWFLGAGMIAGPLAILTMALKGDSLIYTSLYTVTQTLAGLASGYWFFRASERAPTAS